MSALDQVVNKRPAVRRRLKVTPLDIAIIAGAISFIAYLLYRVDAYLVYHWDWGRLLQYFFYYDPDQDQWQSNLLVKGLLITAQTSLWAMLFAFVIGLVMGLCRISQVALFRMISRGYVEFVRNMPPVPFLFIMFFFVGNQLLKPLGLSDLAQEAPPIIQDLIIVMFGELNLLRNFSAAVLALALYEGAYITEIVRAGVLSIERGQWEAGDSLGPLPRQPTPVCHPASGRATHRAAVGQSVHPAHQGLSACLPDLHSGVDLHGQRNRRFDHPVF